MSSLPERYRILPYAAEFRLPGFEGWSRQESFVQAPIDLDVSEWFDAFIDSVISSIGERFFPIVRLSDGEFLLMFGPKLASTRASRFVRLKSLIRLLVFRFNPRARVVALTRGIYPSGDYGSSELPEIRFQYGAACRRIARQGRLALHLEYSERPFTEHYFPALQRWLSHNDLSLDLSNYIPFYFVYALLSGSRRRELLQDRNILIITHADDVKRRRVEQSLKLLGVADVSWYAISERRSAFDAVAVEAEELAAADLVFVAGGLGAPLLIAQLERFAGPVIDVGYMLEVWANPELRHDRPYATDRPPY